MEKKWGFDLIRGFFATIDKAIYGLMATIYQIILDLANATIISSASVENFYGRIYALLGVFMLFKVTFSFINYIISPDTFTDKTKGVQNLIKNTLIVLILIIITPFAFDKLYEAQDAIIGDEIIPRFIFATDESDDKLANNPFKMSPKCENVATAASDGDYLALMTLRPFYQIDDTDYHKNDDMVDPFEHFYCGVGKVKPATYLSGVVYETVTKNKQMYIVDYSYFLSTIVGIVVCLILVSFCFDIAVRTIKMAFLQMIAPIPIISYIDPASTKNGMLSKWFKQVISTWVSLFIRLIALFFAVFIIAEIDKSMGETGGYGFWVMLFLLIGALIFAKQLPKLLEELIPGLKLGGMQLNPFKKVADQAFGGKELLGLGAAGLGAGLATISNIGSHLKDKTEEYKDRKELTNQQSLFNNWKNAHPRGNMTEDAYNRMLERKANEAGGLNEAKNKFQEQQEKRLQRFSFKHPIVANLSQTLSGARIGFNQGKNLKFDPIEIGKQSSNIKDWKDQHDMKDRITERATDFFGIKNDTGTTSMAKQEIKDLTDKLTRTTRAIEMQNKALSDMQTKMGPAEFAKALSRDSKGNYVVNPTYNGNAAYKADLQAIVNAMTQLEDERLALSKEINKQEKIRDKEMPKPGKK